jgi:hypothetical protein
MLFFGRFVGTRGNSECGYSYSTDGGSTWSGPTLYYSISTLAYGDLLESQGFFDTTSNSIMFAVALGDFGLGTGTGTAQVTFQQFLTEPAAVPLSVEDQRHGQCLTNYGINSVLAG